MNTDPILEFIIKAQSYIFSLGTEIERKPVLRSEVITNKITDRFTQNSVRKFKPIRGNPEALHIISQFQRL